MTESSSSPLLVLDVLNCDPQLCNMHFDRSGESMRESYFSCTFKTTVYYNTNKEWTIFSLTNGYINFTLSTWDESRKKCLKQTEVFNMAWASSIGLGEYMATLYKEIK
jgi:hypothetical protein